MKKNNLKLAKGLMMAGILASVLTTGTAFASGNLTPAQQAPTQPEVQIEINDPSQPVQVLDEGFNMPTYLSMFPFLTEAEQQQLNATDVEKEPYYKEMDALVEQIDKISQSILKDTQGLRDEMDNLWAGEEALWSKLTDNATEQQLQMDDFKEFIKASSVLTQEEKDRLLALEDKLESIQDKLDIVDKQVEVATADLSAEMDKLFDKVAALDEKNAAIWDKISQAEQR